MGTRRSLAALHVLLACVAIGLGTASQARILWRALVLSWDLPATQAQDELSVQASLHTDPSQDIERAIVPRRDRGQPHPCVTAPGHSSAACAAGVTRSPPSA
jgi:hypothetical protein